MRGQEPVAMAADFWPVCFGPHHEHFQTSSWHQLLLAALMLTTLVSLFCSFWGLWSGLSEESFNTKCQFDLFFQRYSSTHFQFIFQGFQQDTAHPVPHRRTRLFWTSGSFHSIGVNWTFFTSSVIVTSSYQTRALPLISHLDCNDFWKVISAMWPNKFLFCHFSVFFVRLCSLVFNLQFRTVSSLWSHSELCFCTILLTRSCGFCTQSYAGRIRLSNLKVIL